MCPRVPRIGVGQNGSMHGAIHRHAASFKVPLMLREDEPTRIELNGQPADSKRIAADYQCRLRFDELRDTDHPDVKRRDRCNHSVVKVTDFDEWERAIASRGCIWGVNNIGPIAGGPRPSYFLGVLVTDDGTSSSLSWDD